MSARQSSAAFSVVVVAIIAVLLPAPAVLAADPPSGEETKQDGSAAKENEDAGREGEPESEEPVPVYTNADLERLFGPPEPAPAGGAPGDAEAAPQAAAKPADALEALQHQQASQKTRERQAAEVEKIVAQKEQEVQKLEQRILRIKNPLLPRPEADMTPQEKEQWEGLSATERVEMTQKQLDQAKKELADAEAQLRRLQPK
jgi:hypothetical protein